MLRIAFILAFIISAACATLGVLMSNKLRKEHSHAIYTTLLYQQIFIFIFALYSIWGFILFKLIFSTELLSPALVEKISNAQTLIAVPFQFFSWWFLIQLIFQLVHISNSRWKAALAIVSMVLLILPVYWLFFKNSIGFHHSVSPLFCIENCLVYSFIFLTLLFSKRALIKRSSKFYVALVILFIGTLMSAATLFYSNNIGLTLGFIVLFFIANLWPVGLLMRIVDVPEESQREEANESFDALCTRYEISKREAEIIASICEGLTNQQIADRLFISLQTVKDHTSRIYLKTEVKNRTQLANLFREK